MEEHTCDWISSPLGAAVWEMPYDEAMEHIVKCPNIGRYQMVAVDGDERWLCEKHYDGFFTLRKDDPEHPEIKFNGFAWYYENGLRY